MKCRFVVRDHDGRLAGRLIIVDQTILGTRNPGHEKFGNILVILLPHRLPSPRGRG